jgi:hypothetical protein
MRMPVGGMMTKPEPLQLKVTRPKVLAPAEKLKLVQILFGASSAAPTGFGSSVELTPRNGFIDGQAKLELLDVVALDYENSFAIISKPGHSNPVTCEFKPMAAGRYLVDLTVRSAYNETPIYTIVAGDENVQTPMNLNQTIPDSVGHVIFVYEAKNTDWFSLYVHADKQWVFYSCEVTQLK